MNIEQECANAMAIIQRWIEDSAARAALEIDSSFHEARWQMYRRHDDEIKWSSGVLAGSSLNHINFRPSGTFMLQRNGDVLFSDNPLYVNLPAIIAIWLRSTTLYRVLRVIWLGERA